MGEKSTLDALCLDLAPLGLILGPPGLILRALGQYFGLSMGFPGRFPPTFLAKLLHQVSRNVCGNFSVGLRHRCAGNCWELGTPTHGCNRLGPPGVRRSPRSGLQSARELRLARACLNLFKLLPSTLSEAPSGETFKSQRPSRDRRTNPL